MLLQTAMVATLVALYDEGTVQLRHASAAIRTVTVLEGIDSACPDVDSLNS